MNNNVVFNLKGKTILVTGASGGIGSAIAVNAGSCGASLGVHYRHNKEEAVKVVNEIAKAYGKAEIFQADLTDSSARKKIIKDFIAKFNRIDVLINNAGEIVGYKHFLELDENSWDETYSINVKSPFFLSKEVFPYMIKQGGGKIINIGSISAKYGGSPYSIHYGASKAALESVNLCLAREGAQHNILVNTVRAGFVDTSFHKKIKRSDIEKRISLIPLKKSGQPIDIASMVLFLASDAGNYITGEIFTVAGGD